MIMHNRYNQFIPIMDNHIYIGHPDCEVTSMNTPKKWTEPVIRELVQTNDGVLYGALMQLFKRQTATERAEGVTRNRNGQGFTAYDANFLTSLCVYYTRHGYLTDRQKFAARKKMPKYTKQLTKIANKEM